MVFSKTEIFWIWINSLNQRYGFISTIHPAICSTFSGTIFDVIGIPIYLIIRIPIYLNVSCSSCWGYSLINTLKLKKKFIVSSEHFNCTTSTLLFQRNDTIYLLRLDVFQGCRSCATLRATQIPRVICMFVCVSVHVLNESTIPCHAKSSIARSLDSGLIVRFQVKSTHTEASLVFVVGHVGFFKSSVRIAADFPCITQQWPCSDWPQFEPFLKNVAAFFVDRVLACLPSESVTPRLNHLFEFCCSQLVPLLTVLGMIRQFEKEALLLFKVPLWSCPHHVEKDHPILQFKKHISRMVMTWQSHYMYLASQSFLIHNSPQIVIGEWNVVSGEVLIVTSNSHHSWNSPGGWSSG